MDMRIHRTSLRNKIGTVDKSRRVNPAHQDEPEQDSQRFSNHLKFIEKKHQENEAHDQEQKSQREQNHEEEPEKEAPGNKDTTKLLNPPEAPNKELGNNIDIKV